MNKTHLYDKILSPIVTEKSTRLSEQNKVVFKVPNSSNKLILKKNIEKIFKVNVTKINIIKKQSKSKFARMTVQGFIQFFRNTPPFVQLLFFYFALGQFTPTYSPDGWLEVPIISNFGWAVISLSLFAGAYNVEIFRSGIEAVPISTREAAESLGQ